jgi:hypothetical protein
VSYDLYFLQAEHCADPASFLEQLEEGNPSSTPAADSRKQAVVEALRRTDPSLEPFSFDYDEIAKSLGISVDDARRAYSHVELNGPGDSNGVQITVHSSHVSVTVAYWHGGSKAERVFSTIERYAAEIAAAGSYRIYDPQLERVVDGFGEIRADVLKAYAGVIDQLPHLTPPSEKTVKPWWKF